MIIYAVIDTNVLVSALLAAHTDSPTVLIRDYILEGSIIPLYNEEILMEYKAVLSRPKFGFPSLLVEDLISAIVQTGISSERVETEDSFIDLKDVVFYEVALSHEGSYLVTGNIKHFPKSPIVVTPAEMLAIMKKTAKVIISLPKQAKL